MLSRGLTLSHIVHSARVCQGTEQFVGLTRTLFPSWLLKFSSRRRPTTSASVEEQKYEGDDKHFNWISRAINYFREISFLGPTTTTSNFSSKSSTRKSIIIVYEIESRVSLYKKEKRGRLETHKKRENDSRGCTKYSKTYQQQQPRAVTRQQLETCSFFPPSLFRLVFVSHSSICSPRTAIENNFKYVFSSSHKLFLFFLWEQTFLLFPSLSLLDTPFFSAIFHLTQFSNYYLLSL